LEAIGKAGLILLSLGGLSGILMYISLEKPKGWAGIKEFARLRQGHVDALVIGGILVAADSAKIVDAYTTPILIAASFYTAVSTMALGWVPKLVEKHVAIKAVDFTSLSAFALCWVWLTVRNLAGW
jgi:hypothetical protein